MGKSPTYSSVLFNFVELLYCYGSFLLKMFLLGLEYHRSTVKLIFYLLGRSKLFGKSIIIVCFVSTPDFPLLRDVFPPKQTRIGEEKGSMVEGELVIGRWQVISSSGLGANTVIERDHNLSIVSFQGSSTNPWGSVWKRHLTPLG